jgi:hypothetical protein
MNSRRSFFKYFIGKRREQRDVNREMVYIPLNRLHELPEEIIEQIQPVFFPDEEWKLDNNTLIVFGKNANKEIQLNKIEIETLKLFHSKISLRQIATDLSNVFDKPLTDIYQSVTSLFFKLASLRICHPLEVYDIDELIKTDN